MLYSIAQLPFTAQSEYLCRLLVKLGLDFGRHFFVLDLLMNTMLPHILIEPELIHLFEDNEERDSLCLQIVDVLQTSIRAECDLLTSGIRHDAFGLRNITPAKLDKVCEDMCPKLNTMAEAFIAASKYSNSMSIEVHLSRNRLDIYLSAKYYTGISSMVH